MIEAMLRKEKRKFSDDYKSFGVELEPFGNDTTDNKYRFTGKERDYHTNFDYMHFRFYASSMGRFIKPDNIIPDIKSPLSWNAYAYVNGNPVNFNDPTGHLPATYYRDGIEVGTIKLDSGTVGATGVSSDIDLGTWTWRNQAIQNLHVQVDFRYREMRLLAIAAYNANKPLPWGYEMVGSPFTSSSGFRATTYYDPFLNQYYVAFAGVNQIRDIVQSIFQMVLGQSKQFGEALQYVRTVMNTYHCEPVLVGHSLGGGLAAAVAVQLDLKAYTFNAEGVNSATVGQEALARANNLVTNYWGGRDWLTGIQKMTPLPNAIGKQIYVGVIGHGIEGFPEDIPYSP